MAEPFQSQLPIKPAQIIDILIRRKWLIIIPLCIALTIGLYQTFTTPKLYRASTLILVQPQRVPTSYVRSVVSSNINERISTISQQILSRSNIEKIIDQFGLFENRPDLYLEEKVANIRRRVRVNIRRARGGSESFSVAFTGSDPQQVMRIANTLASYFMDENLKVREAQAIGTSEFLDSEMEKTEKRLQDREQLLSAYRFRYLGELPGELDANLRTLDRIQQQISSKQTLLHQTRDSLNKLETQIAQTKEKASQNLDGMSSDKEETYAVTENEKKLNATRKQYDALLLRYTEKHPDVLRLEKIIEKLKTAVVEEKEAMAGIEEDITVETPNFALIQQESRLKQVQSEIIKLVNDIATLEKRMEVYQQRVDNTPKRELELKNLRRDYSNIQNLYNSLLDRKLEAEISVNMEKKQKGEQFRILDHARLPQKPITPDVKKLLLLALMAGLGTGAGIIFLLEFFDNTIRSEDVIEEDLGLTLLARIPPMKKPGQKRRMALDWMLFSFASLYAVMLLSFFSFVNWKGIDRSINIIKTTLNL